MLTIYQIKNSTTSVQNISAHPRRIRSKKCIVPEWNQKTTSELPQQKTVSAWLIAGNIAFLKNIIDAEPRLVSAFVNPNEITIIITSQHTYGQNVTCLYYDCNRVEIEGSRFSSKVLPMATVFCPRRYGAEFVSLSWKSSEASQEPIPLTFRVYEEPLHELSVCVGSLYGSESKWLQIVEYVEHYRLIGASFFYFSLFEVKEYDRRIIADYERLGLAESVTYVTEYSRMDWKFHMIQINECHHRSRFHSRWVINMDIDERLVYLGSETLLDFLSSIPSTIAEISFSTSRVLKTEPLPEKYTNESALLDELMFLKYTNTTTNTWYNMKGIIRPELVTFLFYHWSMRQFNGSRVMSVSKRFGYVRHYRTTEKNTLNDHWPIYYNGSFSETRLEATFERDLIEAVKRKVKYVYDQRMVRCEEILKWYFHTYKSNLLDCNLSSKQ